MSTFRLSGKAALAVQCIAACQQHVPSFAGAIWRHTEVQIGCYQPDLKEDLEPEAFWATVVLRDGRKFRVEGSVKDWATTGICYIAWETDQGNDIPAISKVDFTFEVGNDSIDVKWVTARTIYLQF